MLNFNTLKLGCPFIMSYNYLKIFHILSAALLFASMGYGSYLWWNMQENTQVSSRIQIHTACIILPITLLQLFSGFTLINIQHYDFNQLWIKGSVLSFSVMLGSWLGFIYFLITALAHPLRQVFYRRLQGIFLLSCGMGLCGMLFFMANKIA